MARLLTSLQAQHLRAALGDARQAMAKAQKAAANAGEFADDENPGMIGRELFVAQMEIVNALQALQRAELNVGM